MGRLHVVVIGAGIVGLATAREVHFRLPDAQVTVLEKETAVARHQTGHNSGVVHAGIYYKPGSLKARLCMQGRELLRRFCDVHGLSYDECGKVVVATDETQIPLLRNIEARAAANGVPDVRWLAGASQISEIEPHAAGVAGLHSPRTAIVDFTKVAEAIAAELDVQLGFAVTSIRYVGDGVVVAGAGDEIRADRVVICAGLQSDRVALLAGDGPAPAIVPFRGEYWRLVPSRTGLVRGLIYPVPDPDYPFLGVHFTRRVDGSVDVGPNAVLALAREGYRRSDIVARDVASALRWPGFRKMARNHWRAGLVEMRGSLSKNAFVAAARRLVPSLTAGDVVPAPPGVRAQAVDADGTLVDDFRIGRCGPRGQVLAVRNAPSPGATSSMAIAQHIVQELVQSID